MACTVCNHPERQAIDLALLNRTATLAELSRQHQLSQSALHRHKQHLLQKMAATQNRFYGLLQESYLFSLYSLLNSVMGSVQKAEADGDARLVLKAAGQATAILKFMHKLDFPLALDTVYRLLESPEWSEHESLLPDLKVLQESRLDLADNLLSPCPEDPPAVTPEDVDLMQPYLQALSPEAAQPPTDNRRPETANRLGQREKGGKKAKKTGAFHNKFKQSQIDKLFEKNAGKSPATRNPDLDTPAWVKALDEGRLDINTLNAIGAGRPIDLDLAKCFLPA